MQFRRSGSVPLLSLEEKERQGRVVKSAQAELSGLDAVRDFLNTHHKGLQARPLDRAISSDAGLVAVERAITAESRRTRGRQRRALPAQPGTGT